MRLLIPILLFVVAEPAASSRTQHLNLILLGGSAPVRIELHVQLGELSVASTWDAAFARMVKFFDSNGDQAIDRAEAARLPVAFSLRQLAWGQFAPFVGDAPPFDRVDHNHDGRLSVEEVTADYVRAGLGGVLVGYGRPAGSGALTDAILERVDADRDGDTSLREWQAAPAALHPLDHDGDELIAPAELVAGTTYPGAVGAILLTPSDGAAEPTDALLPRFLLSPTTNASAIVWRIHFDSEHDTPPIVEPAEGVADQSFRRHLAAARACVEVRSDQGTLPSQTAAAHKRLSALFSECDLDGNRRLETAELKAPRAEFFLRSLQQVDCNSDDAVAATEFEGWLDVLDAFARSQILSTILDHGPGLFEFLDDDHDGALSTRELRTAAGRLKDAGTIAAGDFDRSELPRQWIVTVSHGRPRTPLVRPVRTGPVWFLGMDRNSDGDLSRREFLGPAELFSQLDGDRDELLSVAEAERYAAGK